MNCLVTGAAGFIGSHTVEAFLRAGHRVLGVDNFRTGRPENLNIAKRHNTFRFAELDITNEVALNDVVAEFRPDAAIHLAAMVSVPESIEQPDDNFRINALGTDCVAQAARRHGVRRFVFASSAAVYGADTEMPIEELSQCTPRSPYGASKLASEHLLMSYARCYDIVVRCQRYFNVYGPRQDPSSSYSGVISRFATRAFAGEPLQVHGDGEQTRDFIFVGDVAEANVLAATLPNIGSGVANICTGQATSLNGLIEKLSVALGRPLRAEHGSPRAGDIRGSVGDTARAEKELGFHSQIRLSQGLESYLADLRPNHPASL